MCTTLTVACFEATGPDHLLNAKKGLVLDRVSEWKSKAYVDPSNSRFDTVQSLR